MKDEGLKGGGQSAKIAIAIAIRVL